MGIVTLDEVRSGSATPDQRGGSCDTYEAANGKRIALLHRGRNVKRNSVWIPFSGEASIVTDHPVVRYGIDGGPCDLGFHDRVNEKYKTWLRLDTGEMIIKSLDWENEPAITPTVGDNKHSLTWQWGPNAWIRETVTPEGVKETIAQPANRAFSMYYKLTGFTVEKIGRRYKLTANSGRVLYMDAPYYMGVDGSWLGWVDTTIQNLGDGLYRITYPEQPANVLIDPTITFGGTEGAVGHRDTYLDELNPNYAYGDSDRLRIGYRTGLGMSYYGLVEFDTAAIPGNATALSAMLGVYLQAHIGAGDLVIQAHCMESPWTEGATQAPALDGQSTWSYQNAQTSRWSGGGNISPSDYNADILGSATVPGSAPVDSLYEIDVTNWFAIQAACEGLLLKQGNFANNLKNFYSLQESNADYRPTLTVEYNPPASGGIGRLRAKRGRGRLSRASRSVRRRYSTR